MANGFVAVARPEIPAMSPVAPDISNGLITARDVDATNVARSGKTRFEHLVDHTSGHVNVKSYGATGDGTTDDTAAIQAALDAARVAGGGTVLIPLGTFIVKPGPSTALRIGSNVTLAGAGDGSVLKVSNATGVYPKLIGPYPDDSATVTNVTLRDFKIDQNPSGNATADVQQGLAGARYATAISIPKFQNVTITGVTIDPMTGVNGISLNGAGSSGALVQGNHLRFVQSPTTLGAGYYDHTAVYLDCARGRAVGNTIEAASLADRAGGGIELHGGPGLSATGNTILRYTAGIHIVSLASGSENPSSDISATGNTITDAGFGVLLWSITGYKLRNVVVANNTVSINNIARAVAWPSGDGVSSQKGIGFVNNVDGTLSGTFDGVIISGNSVVFDQETRTLSSESETYGLGGTPQGAIAHLHITGNILRNAPAVGIKLGPIGGLSAATIAGNRVVNAGNNANVSVAAFRSAVFFSGAHSDVIVENNHISDTNASVAGLYSIFMDGAGTYSGVVLRGNTEAVVSGAYRRQVNASALDDAAAGSARYVLTSFPPTKLSVQAGDEVVYRNGSATTVMAVSGVGSWGTLVGVTANTTIGTAIITVSSAAGLARGDWISVAGAVAGAQILAIYGTSVTLSASATASVSGAAVAYVNPGVRHLATVKVVVTYSASMTIDAWTGTDFEVTANNGSAFTFNAPTHVSTGQRMRIRVINTSGGVLGNGAWANPYFKTATGFTWTAAHDANAVTARPATGFNRTIEFMYDGTSWIEQWRSPADVAN